MLKGAVVLAALPLAGFTGERRLGPLPADPFTLGVASGEPAPDGMVIWTRLAPRPLADDGLGGMPARAVEVEWQVASDERFTRMEQRGITTASPEMAHSVHVELTGLQPAAEYFYRFRADGYLSPTGRTRTAPASDSLAALTMCIASCSNSSKAGSPRIADWPRNTPISLCTLVITNTSTPQATATCVTTSAPRR